MQRLLKSKISLDIYSSLLFRLGIMTALSGVCRIIFYFVNIEMFPDTTRADLFRMMTGGLKFDLSGVLYTNCIYILSQIIPFKFRYNRTYRKTSGAIFFITNAIALALNCIDMIYYRFTLRRTTWSVFGEFAEDKGNFALMRQFVVDYPYVVLIWAALVICMILSCSAVRIKYYGAIKNRTAYYGLSTLIAAVCFGLFVAGVRGGFGHSVRPITISNALAYVNRPVEVGIVLNTPFSIYRTLERSGYPILDYFDDEELSSIYSPIHYPPEDNRFNPKNVVIIIVESLSKEYVGSLNKDLDSGKYKGYTPFIDSLISVSYTSERTFGNGLKSIDAIPSILASIPSFYDPYILSIYSNNEIKGLASLLSEKGYDCSFFHGAPNGSMGFDAFAGNAGFENYYGKTEYGNNADYDGLWGIWDEPFLQYAAEILNSKKEPFLGVVFTVSSHHPFKVPEKYNDSFPVGTLDMHKCIGYADMAVKRFFETASRMSWFENTLFVVTADHTNQIQYDKSRTSIGPFMVPIIFYDPSGELKGTETHKIIQQIDIMPTLLGLLNYDKPYFAFGFDVFSTENNFAINYFNNTFQTLRNDYVLLSGNDTRLFDYSNDPLLSNDCGKSLPDTVLLLDNYRKAFTQTYNKLLNDNKMKYQTNRDSILPGQFND